MNTRIIMNDSEILQKENLGGLVMTDVEKILERLAVIEENILIIQDYMRQQAQPPSSSSLYEAAMKAISMPIVLDTRKDSCCRIATEREKNRIFERCCCSGDIDDYPENGYEELDLLTNFGESALPLYKKAIEQFGDDDLYISDKAYNMHGAKMENSFSLRTKIYKDRSDFWNLFDRLREENNADLYESALKAMSMPIVLNTREDACCRIATEDDKNMCEYGSLFKQYKEVMEEKNADD